MGATKAQDTKSIADALSARLDAIAAPTADQSDWAEFFSALSQVCRWFESEHGAVIRDGCYDVAVRAYGIRASSTMGVHGALRNWASSVYRRADYRRADSSPLTGTGD
jgi:hypothetical protein